MATEATFDEAYRKLAGHTNGFTDVSLPRLTAALTEAPDTLAPLRMILGFTHNELAWAMKLSSPGISTSGSTLKKFERSPAPDHSTAKRAAMIDAIADAVVAVMDRSILQVPDSAQDFFHSKLDKRDTLHGWDTVAASTEGVPYSALLYQRYVGGVWRQVQDAYSEIKGDKPHLLPVHPPSPTRHS